MNLIVTLQVTLSKIPLQPAESSDRQGKRKKKKRHSPGKSNHLAKFSAIRNKESFYLQTGTAERTGGAGKGKAAQGRAASAAPALEVVHGDSQKV